MRKVEQSFGCEIQLCLTASHKRWRGCFAQVNRAGTETQKTFMFSQRISGVIGVAETHPATLQLRPHEALPRHRIHLLRPRRPVRAQEIHPLALLPPERGRTRIHRRPARCHDHLLPQPQLRAGLLQEPERRRIPRPHRVDQSRCQEIPLFGHRPHGHLRMLSRRTGRPWRPPPPTKSSTPSSRPTRTSSSSSSLVPTTPWARTSANTNAPTSSSKTSWA